jgi:hypothetical protein
MLDAEQYVPAKGFLGLSTRQTGLERKDCRCKFSLIGRLALFLNYSMDQSSPQLELTCRDLKSIAERVDDLPASK